MRNMKGFSLIELLVVVAIIGVLAAAGVVGYQNYTQTAKENVAKNNYANVVRYVRNQAGVLASGISTGTCGPTNIAKCDDAEDADGHLITYFGDNGFENPFSANLNAVSVAGAVNCQSDSDAQNGYIIVAASGANELRITGCDSFSDTAASASVAVVEWK